MTIEIPRAPRIPAHKDSLAAAFATLKREDLLEIATIAIDEVDRRDGDVDLEEDNEDRCSAHDDNVRPIYLYRGLDQGAGDPDDAEYDGLIAICSHHFGLAAR